MSSTPGRGRTSPALVVAVGILLACAVGLAAFLLLPGGGDQVSRPATTPASPPSSPTEPASGPTPEPTGSPSPRGLPDDVHPFTGRRDGHREPVLAVKIDNVARARPHTALSRADLVYVERVEAGLSRLLGVYSSRLPPAVGPIRSARESDIELLRQFGRPAFAFSGAQSRLLPLLARAPFHDVSHGRAGSAYFRRPGRPAPHNLYARPDQLLDQAPKASTARDIGFRFGPAPDGGRAASHYRVGYPAFRLGLRWSPDLHRWLVSMDGRPLGSATGGRPQPATVVVQHVRIRSSRFQDSGGNVSPYTDTTGSGTAVVLRNGRAYRARWSRPRPSDGTSFTRPGGGPMRFARGQVWVVLAER